MREGTLSRVDVRHPLVWGIPLLALLAAAAVLASGANRDGFLLLNGIGLRTGDALWAQLTILGDTTVALALCLPLWRRRADLMWALVFGALISTLWVHGIKPVAKVDRPAAVLGEAVHVIGPVHKRSSFPSGHATTAFAVAGLYAIGLRKQPVTALVLVLASLAALSRCVVGVHWPLDILAGVFGGWLSAVLGLKLGQATARAGARAWVQWAVGTVLAGCALALILGYNTGYESRVFQAALGVLCLSAAFFALRRGAGVHLLSR